MTRPGIVRADTLDLQNQDAPSAQDHSHSSIPADSNNDQLGQHQASEIRHVNEERHSEDMILQEAWNQAAHDSSQSQYADDDGYSDQHYHSQHNAMHPEDADHTDDEEDADQDSDDDMMMDRMSSSPSIDDEDIDFDFVYALHTFVATVEGQANATKGDTMVLLDDSNSYWWLVRIVKDGSIGYLPAEHIETPTERLARLNKHRNVDLSQTMLGDNAEKSKNPLKKAMRRRNVKTVQFAAPTYVEASDYEYDTEDEENAALAEVYSNGNGTAQHDSNVNTDHAEHRESADASDDLKSGMSDSSSSGGEANDVHVPIEEPLGSPPLVDSTEAAPLKSRKGTPRNADSFLKNEGAEPRRITLTPNILRDDGSSMSSLEKTRSTSFESLEKADKIVSPPKEAKEEKKKKEKKQGMLSGLFKSKKKDKKSKAGDDDSSSIGEGEKVSGEIPRQTSSQSSGQSSPTFERNPSLIEKRAKPQKLQPTSLNTATTILSPVRESSPQALQQTPQQASQQAPQQAPQRAPQEVQQQMQQQVQQQEQQPVQQPVEHHLQQAVQQHEQQKSPSPLPSDEVHPTEFYAELEGSQVAYEAPTGQEDQIRDIQSRQSTRSPEVLSPQLQQSSSMSALTAFTNKIRSNTDENQVKKQKVKKAKKRVELDDFDEPSEDDTETAGRQRSESPVDIVHGTFMHGTEAVHIPTNMDDDDSSTQGQRTPDERASEGEGEEERTNSPDMVDVPTEGEPHLSEMGASAATDDDPTPVPSKPQSPDPTMFTHQPGLPNLLQSPTPPPARQAPFPPTSRQRAQSESIQRSVTPLQKYSHRAESSMSTISTQPSPAGSTISKDTLNSWNDVSLRAWLDGGQGNDIRDMLVVIHDKSNVRPVGHDHPLMKGLWNTERTSCNRMMGELDGLLGQWLGKKKTSRNVQGASATVTVQSSTTTTVGA